MTFSSPFYKKKNLEKAGAWFFSRFLTLSYLFSYKWVVHFWLIVFQLHIYNVPLVRPPLVGQIQGVMSSLQIWPVHLSTLRWSAIDLPGLQISMIWANAIICMIWAGIQSSLNLLPPTSLTVLTLTPKNYPWDLWRTTLRHSVAHHKF